MARMAAGSRGASDTSTLLAPIELGSPTIIQLLDARATSTNEVIGYLEQECDAVLECRLCRSLFRSLANFIAHKRIYCMRTYKEEQAMRRFYANPSVPVVEPTDPDIDRLTARSSKPTGSGRRTINAGRKGRPVRKTVPADLTKIKERPPVEVVIEPIEGVSCAMSQVVVGSESDGRSSAANSNPEKVEVITTVEPKDGYPNMNLRQRSGKPSLALECQSEWEDIEDDNSKTDVKSKNISSKVALAEVLSKRIDCDFTKMKCLTCDTTFATAKTLNFHMLNKHGKKRNLYPCIYCKNVFTQFWGVTRHLKSAHNLSGDAIDKAREMIRSRVYSESLGSLVEGSEHRPLQLTPEKKTVDSNVHLTKSSLCCNLCSKVFGKRQYLYLHMVACYKKAGLEPPPFKKQETEEKAPKPLLFVCKTCNRAFSMRQNMVMHAVACGKRRKEGVSTEDNPTKETEDANKNPPPAQEKEETSAPVESPKVESPTGSSEASNDTHSSTDSALKKASPTKYDSDDILSQLSPSDEAKEEERNQTPPVTPTSLALGRPKRNLKPKQFSDGTINVRRKIPEVVRVQQADGSQVYKLRQDVEVVSGSVSPPNLSQIIQPDAKIIQPESQAVKPIEEEAVPESKVEDTDDIVKAKDNKGMRILIQGESVPLLDEDDEAKLAGMVDISKLVCLKCKRQYGSSSNLRRHAVRHLGWRRYKCKLCKFTSYNKSECKSHLRKCHNNEVATLLDGGLSPYIIDLGALLDEGCDDGNSKLNLSLPAAENGRNTPTNRKTRGRSKEPVVADKTAAVKEPSKAEESNKGGRRKSGRTRKHGVENSSDEKITTTSPDASTQSAFSANSEKSPEVAGSKPRGRARKQELSVMSDIDGTSQDENNKRAHSAISGASVENGQSETSASKIAKVAEGNDMVNSVESKQGGSRLEGLVNKLRGIRKPLVGTEDNTKAINVESVSVPVNNEEDNPQAASALSPSLIIPTTVTEVVASGDN